MAANHDKILKRVIGLLLQVGGAGLAFLGYQLSGSLTAQVSKTVTDALPDAVMYRYIVDAISSVAGMFLLIT